MESLKESIQNGILNDPEVCPKVKENILQEKYAGFTSRVELVSLEKVKNAYYQATNLLKEPSEIIQRLYQELNS